jgi:hypothetical protein
MHCLPGTVVKVRVPRGPSAVERERQLLVVLVLLTPHPESCEHSCLESDQSVLGYGERMCARTRLPDGKRDSG